MTKLDPKLTDEDAQKVIARALELQAQNATALTVTQVREIASDLSIPQSAVDQALAEYRAAAGNAEADARASVSVAPPRRNRLRRVIVLSLASVGGAFVLFMILTMIARS
jgi:hypothetical protein